MFLFRGAVQEVARQRWSRQWDTVYNVIVFEIFYVYKKVILVSKDRVLLNMGVNL